MFSHSYPKSRGAYGTRNTRGATKGTRGKGRFGSKSDKRDPSMRRSPRFFSNKSKYVIPADTKIDYKEVNLLQRYVSERGKILSRRVTGISAKAQRALTRAINQARYLGLITVLGTKRR